MTTQQEFEAAEALPARIRSYVEQHEGMCWCGFEDDGLSADGAIDHIAHCVVDDRLALITVGDLGALREAATPAALHHDAAHDGNDERNEA